MKLHKNNYNLVSRYLHCLFSRTIILFFALLSCLTIFSQSGKLKVTVRDLCNNKTTPIVTINIFEDKNVIISSGGFSYLGDFNIKDVPVGTYSILISSINFGFEKQSKKMNIHKAIIFH